MRSKLNIYNSLETLAHSSPANKKVAFLYSASQEEKSIFWEVIASVIRCVIHQQILRGYFVRLKISTDDQVIIDQRLVAQIQ
jgi:hypothetical protein